MMSRRDPADRGSTQFDKVVSRSNGLSSTHGCHQEPPQWGIHHFARVVRYVRAVRKGRRRVTPLIIVVLAVMWIAVLVPPLLRSRSDGRPSSSIAGFRDQLSRLQSSGPSRPYATRPAAAYRSTASVRQSPISHRSALREAQKVRRRNILVGLVGFALLTGVVGLGMGIPLAKTLFLVSVALLALYVYALVQIRKDAEARAVRYEWSSRAA